MTNYEVHTFDESRETAELDPRDSVSAPVAMSPLKKGLLWLGLLAFFSLVIVCFGIHLGANGEDKWYTDAVVWLVTKFK